MNNIYKIGFFTLLLVNLVLLALFSFPSKPGVSQQGVKELISEVLAFTEEQKELFGEMAKNHRDLINELDKEEKTLIRQYFDNLNIDNKSQINNDSILEEISQVQQKKVSLTYAHFEELKSICTEEQLSDFDKIMDAMMQVLLGQSEELDIPPPSQRESQ